MDKLHFGRQKSICAIGIELICSLLTAIFEETKNVPRPQSRACSSHFADELLCVWGQAKHIASSNTNCYNELCDLL